MPRKHNSRREVLNIIKKTDVLSELLTVEKKTKDKKDDHAEEGAKSAEEHYKYEIDLEVNVYGRNYGTNKKVGPYINLFTYDAGEQLIREGEWEANSFYILVDGMLDVLTYDEDERRDVVRNQIKPVTAFGEMSLLAGVPRNATVQVSPGQSARVLEVQRPALRLLHKLDGFNQHLSGVYGKNARSAALDELEETAGLTKEDRAWLIENSLFKVFANGHTLVSQGRKIDRLILIKDGWMDRSYEEGELKLKDLLGKGHCFGLEAYVTQNKGLWPYTITVSGRTEALEISLRALRHNPPIQQKLINALQNHQPPQLTPTNQDGAQKVRQSQERLIDTGLVDATNLLVMDMDLCVRCGNCSFACQQVHGQSRLLRQGIHITRLKKPSSSSSIQSLLAPSVCLHCENPECLTGCPTGSITRFGQGHIDIKANLCIGCGDCATQCPYNAISMAPRKIEPLPKPAGLGRIGDFFKLTADPVREYFGAPGAAPAGKDGKGGGKVDELLAVKCNLCYRTPLNPVDKQDKPVHKTKVYSCEESCPTGALARINPRDYFSEIGPIEGLLMVDSTHAVGRNIHKSDPKRTALHALGVLVTLVLTAAAILGLWRYSMGTPFFGPDPIASILKLGWLNMRWSTALIGLIGIGGAMLYPVRRHRGYLSRSAGALRYWLPFHLYSGIVAAIMIILHGGKTSGGLLTTALMISFDLVIFTGVLGYLLYLIVPRIMTQIEGSPLLIENLDKRRKELQTKLIDFGTSPDEELRSFVRTHVISRFTSLGYLVRQYLRREPIDVWLKAAVKELDPQISNITSKYSEQVIALLDAKDAKFSGMFSGLAARHGNNLAIFLSKAVRPELAFQARGSASFTSRQMSSTSLLMELAFADLSELVPPDLKDSLLGTARVEIEDKIINLALKGGTPTQVKAAIIKSIIDALTEHYRKDFVEPIETAATLRRVEALIYLHKLIRIWIAPHVVTTSFMLALMGVHIVQVIFFYGR